MCKIAAGKKTDEQEDAVTCYVLNVLVSLCMNSITKENNLSESSFLSQLSFYKALKHYQMLDTWSETDNFTSSEIFKCY